MINLVEGFRQINRAQVYCVDTWGQSLNDFANCIDCMIAT